MKTNRTALTFQMTRDKNKTVKVLVPIGYKKISLPMFEEWISALESGKYRQTKETLCETKNKRYYYCCLGLLSRIQGRLKNGCDGVNGETIMLSVDNPLYSFLTNTGLFQGCVQIHSKGRVMVEADVLSHLNDLGLTFKEIAKIIKVFWKK